MVDKDRRLFLSKGLRAVGAFALGGAAIGAWSQRRSEMDNNQAVVLDAVLNSQYSASPRQLLNEFVVAESKDLMRRYAIGFTSSILSFENANVDWRTNQLQSLVQVSDDKYKLMSENRHRAKAFPAALSAHILPSCSSTDLLYANDIIESAYSWSQREVQEIVSQNLVCSLIRDVYSWSNYWISDRLLSVIEYYILSSRAKNPLLNTGASIAIQFLCYYQLSLTKRVVSRNLEHTKANQLLKLVSIFQGIGELKDEYAWLIKDWLHELKQLCSYAATTEESDEILAMLPPQQSELIMGWRFFSKPNHPWFRLLSSAIRINNLLPFFNNILVTNQGGVLSDSLSQIEYGEAEARVALGKSMNWYKDMAISEDVFKQVMLGCQEGAFKKNIEAVALATSVKRAGQERHPDWSLVPFSRKQSPIPYEAIHDNTEFEDFLYGGLFGASAGLFLSLVYEISNMQWNRAITRTPKGVEERVRPTRDTIEEAISEPEVVKDKENLIKLLDGSPEAMWKQNDKPDNKANN